MNKDVAASRESEWQSIETAPKDRIIDVYVWGLLDAGLDDGFRWTEVKLIRTEPQTLAVWEEHPEGDGNWREYELSENGQFASHWMPLPAPPQAATS